MENNNLFEAYVNSPIRKLEVHGVKSGDGVMVYHTHGMSDIQNYEFELKLKTENNIKVSSNVAEFLRQVCDYVYFYKTQNKTEDTMPIVLKVLMKHQFADEVSVDGTFIKNSDMVLSLKLSKELEDYLLNI